MTNDTFNYLSEKKEELEDYVLTRRLKVMTAAFVVYGLVIISAILIIFLKGTDLNTQSKLFFSLLLIILFSFKVHFAYHSVSS